MKKTILLTTALIIFMSIKLDARPNLGISFNFFYSSLRPYGEWIQLDNDLVVWHPNGVAHNWRPYSIGRWSWTSDGWYWDSYEPFGWATYHYGRWYDDDYYGWIWIPDYEWGPSWVEWRYDDDYIGWAPLPPYASFNMNFGIHFSIGWHSHYNYWNFVGYNRFYDRRVYNYFLDERRCENIFARTKYRTNYYSDRDRIINGGIDRSFIERRGGYRIAERKISSVDNYRDFERNRQARNDRVIAYRPSDREVENSRTTDRFDFKRGENGSTLERDKIRTPLTREDGRSVNSDRTVEGNRDINVERDTRNDERRIREETNRIQSNDQLKRNTERDRIRINAENKRIEKDRNQKREEIINRETTRERQPVFEQPNRTQRQSTPERRVEPRSQQTYERPAPRVERGNDRGNERSSSKSERSSNRSSERKR